MKIRSAHWKLFLFCFENYFLAYFWDVLIGLIPTKLETSHRGKLRAIVFALVTHSALSVFPLTPAVTFATYPETALDPRPPVTPSHQIQLPVLCPFLTGHVLALEEQLNSIHWASRSPAFLGVLLHMLLLLSSIHLSLSVRIRPPTHHPE